MHDYRVALADAVEVVQRLAPAHEVILGEDLEPVHARALRENRGVMLGPQPESETERFHAASAWDRNPFLLFVGPRWVRAAPRLP